MLAAAQKAGADWRLLYGGRTSASMAFVREIRAVAGHGSRVQIRPQDEHGCSTSRASSPSPSCETIP